ETRLRCGLDGNASSDGDCSARRTHARLLVGRPTAQLRDVEHGTSTTAQPPVVSPAPPPLHRLTAVARSIPLSAQLRAPPPSPPHGPSRSLRSRPSFAPPLPPVTASPHHFPHCAAARREPRPLSPHRGARPTRSLRSRTS
ncbi:hypothetical protein chiPu_0025012, partial [Chiloscyllium punctatum]|nr:hypothetical protein [Chiloscyllium punctatum]